MIDKYTSKDKPLSEQRAVHKVEKCKKRIGHEMRLTAEIGEFEMDQVILDLGSDANVLLKQTWERMGRPALRWSSIELRMVNQQNILPMGCLDGVTVDIEGAHDITDFEVIEIVDESNPYMVLLGIDWAFDINAVINLKECNMTFEKKE